MSNGDWRPIIALGFIAALLFVPPAFQRFGLYQARHAQERVQASQHNTGDGRQHGEAACVDVSSGNGVTCSFVIEQPSETDSQAKYDLRAQQEMAQWALLMAIISAGGVVVALVGLYWIGGTLIEQRKATQTTVELLDLERRPHLAVELVRANRIRWNRKKAKVANIPENCLIRNYGRGSAVVHAIYRAWVVTDVDKAPTPVAPPDVHPGWWRGENIALAVGAEAATAPMHSLSHRIGHRPEVPMPKKSQWLYFIGYIEYADVAGLHRYEAGFCYVFRTDQPERGLHLAMPENAAAYNYNRQVA